MIITKIIVVRGPGDVKNALDYIMNPEKTYVEAADFREVNLLGPIGAAGLPEGNYTRQIRFDERGNAIQAYYVTGHLCRPERAWEDFLAVVACASRMHGKAVEPPLAYEFVQSFEDDIRLTPEMAHRIGLELIERKFSQFLVVMTTHAHSIEDEYGIRGAKIHNHFMICAYREPTFCMEEDAIKLNRNHTLEDELRVENDRLAIEYDLTLVRDPDLHRSHSWYMEMRRRAEESWVEMTKKIIEVARDTTQSWEEFVKKLEAEGYALREEPHLVYVTPEQQEIRAGHLGEEYTRAALEGNWATVRSFQDIFEDMMCARKPPALRSLMDRYGTLYVDVPVGISKGQKGHYQRLSLKKRRSRESIASYFDPLRTYTIRNSEGRKVDTISGHYLREYFDAMRMDRLPDWAVTAKPTPNARQEDGYWYVGPGFQRDKEAEAYRVCWYNEDGTKRHLWEVVLRLAAVTFLGENVYKRNLPPNRRPNISAAQKELLIAGIVMTTMKEERAECIDDLEALLKKVREEQDAAKKNAAIWHTGLSPQKRRNAKREMDRAKARVEKLETVIKYAREYEIPQTVKREEPVQEAELPKEDTPHPEEIPGKTVRPKEDTTVDETIRQEESGEEPEEKTEEEPEVPTVEEMPEPVTHLAIDAMLQRASERAGKKTYGTTVKKDLER